MTDYLTAARRKVFNAKPFREKYLFWIASGQWHLANIERRAHNKAIMSAYEILPDNPLPIQTVTLDEIGDRTARSKKYGGLSHGEARS